MGIVFGVIAALFWGTGDFMITYLTRRVGSNRAMVYIQALSLLSWVVLLTTQSGMPLIGSSILAIALVAGICHVVGLRLTYRAFEVGTLSLVSPIASSFAIVTAVIALASGSEQPPILALGGSVLLVGGIALATRAPGGERKVSLAGVPEALGSALAFGTMFWLFDVYVTPQLGYVWPLILLKTLATGSAVMSLAATRSQTAEVASVQGSVAILQGPGTAPTKIGNGTTATTWLLAIGAAVTDTLAWLAWIWGIRTDYATIVTALASLFSVVTILLAWALLRERLARSQWIGVAIILCGILMVSF